MNNPKMNIQKCLDNSSNSAKTNTINISRGLNGLLASNLNECRVVSGTFQGYLYVKYGSVMMAKAKLEKVNKLTETFKKLFKTKRLNVFEQVKTCELPEERLIMRRLREERIREIDAQMFDWIRRRAEEDYEDYEDIANVAVIDEKNNNNLCEDLAFTEVKIEEPMIYVNCEKEPEKRSFLKLLGVEKEERGWGNLSGFEIIKMFHKKNQIPNLREKEIMNLEIRKQKRLEKERLRREKLKEIKDADKEDMSCNDIINLFLVRD